MRSNTLVYYYILLLLVRNEKIAATFHDTPHTLRPYMIYKHEDVYIDMIYSLRCCDPCEITSQKFSTYVCMYVCASVCPALNPLVSISISLSFSSNFSSSSLSLYFWYYRSHVAYIIIYTYIYCMHCILYIIIYILRINSAHIFFFLSHVSVRVQLAWMCDSMFEPRALRPSHRLGRE